MLHNNRNPALMQEAIRMSADTGAPLILVVADHLHLRHSLRNLFETHRYAVVTAEDTYEATELLHSMDVIPSLIVHDVGRREIDGHVWLVTVRVHNRWTGIPFLFLTNKPLSELSADFRTLPRVAYVEKPYAVRRLLDAVAALLAQGGGDGG